MTALVVVLGDSIVYGTGAADGKPWHQRITNRSASEWRAYGVGGQTMQSPAVSAAAVAAMASGYSEALLLIYLGINDVTGGRTGAQIFSDMDAYRATVQASGWKVVAATLPNYAANNTPGADLRTALLASVNFNGVADLATALPNSADATYFLTDGIHPNATGHGVIGSTFNTAMGLVV